MSFACRHVFVAGRVQGVGFRWHARAKAQELGLAGWVRNLPDGRVELWLEGEEQPVGAMLAWLAKGPPSARVTGVEAVERACEGSAGFELRR
ncbi:MAG: acylphosphatase [Planctomycetes bacterium]|nr:acylphosphatase [Planctomycetota bacterium]